MINLFLSLTSLEITDCGGQINICVSLWYQEVQMDWYKNWYEQGGIFVWDNRESLWGNLSQYLLVTYILVSYHYGTSTWYKYCMIWYIIVLLGSIENILGYCLYVRGTNHNHNILLSSATTLLLCLDLLGYHGKHDGWRYIMTALQPLWFGFSVDDCSVLCLFFVYFHSMFACFSINILSVFRPYYRPCSQEAAQARSAPPDSSTRKWYHLLYRPTYWTFHVLYHDWM